MINNYVIDKYLNLIGENLQLTPNKFDELRRNYQALSSYIANQHKLSEDEEYSIYQQGSFAIDTAIKPLKGDDFDVDMIVEFDMNKNDISPMVFYNELLKTFKEGRYGDIVEEYRNCIRINYNNNYHFDIMPAIPTSKKSKSLFVPDKKKRDWVIRSPKLYKEWFIKQASKIEGYNINFINNKYILEEEIKPLNKPKDYQLKPTLNRVVQLIKRSRDIFFKDTEDRYPQSIVLTTLAGKFYKGEYSVIDALQSIVSQMKSLIESNNRFDLFNPASCGTENFTEKWKIHTIYYDNFKNFCDFLNKNVNELYSYSTAKKALINLFGDSIIDTIKEQTKYDSFWNNINDNSTYINIFPDTKITINKKERGNA